MKRPIRPIGLANAVPSTIPEALPEIIWIDPCSIVIDPAYQRDLSDRSMKLIRKIVSTFDWSQFNLPSVVRISETEYECVNGQHTSIAAASHPGISKIPVFVISGDSVEDRARAFLGHNRNRLNCTATQNYYAALVAKDEDALDVKQVCDRAGVNILQHPRGNGLFRPSDTLAVGTIYTLIKNRGVIKARQVLEIPVRAKCAPVTSSSIRAVDYILYDCPNKESIVVDDLITVLYGYNSDPPILDGTSPKMRSWMLLAGRILKDMAAL